MVKQLLNISTYRRLKLVEFLDQVPTWLSPKEVAEKNQSSLKTLQTDVEYINDFWGDYLHIAQSKAQGLRLDNISFNKLSNVYDLIYQESNEFQFIEQLLYNPTGDAEFWIKQFYMSEASFYRMANNVAGFLERRGLELQRNPFRVTGKKEEWVRLFYQRYFSEAYDTRSWPFKMDREDVLCFIMRISTEVDLVLDDRETQNLAYLFLVSIIRQNHGFTLEPAQYEAPDDIIDTVIQYSQDYAIKIFADSPYQILDKWQREIARTLFHQFYQWDNPEQEQRLEKKMKDFLDRLTQTLNFELMLDDRKKILQEILQWGVQYQFYPYPRTILFNKHRRFSLEVQRVYPVFSAVVVALLTEIGKKESSDWLKVHYHDILTLLLKDWHNLPTQLEKLRKQVSIIVVSDLGIKHSQMLRSFLIAQYSDKISVDIYKKPLLFSAAEDLAVLKKYDLVVSNNPLSNYGEDNFLVVNDFFSSSDRENVFRFILKVQKAETRRYLRKIGHAGELPQEDTYPYAAEYYSLT